MVVSVLGCSSPMNLNESQKNHNSITGVELTSFEGEVARLILTAKPIMATRPTKSSFALVKPIPPEVPKIPSSTFGFIGAA